MNAGTQNVTMFYGNIYGNKEDINYSKLRETKSAWLAVSSQRNLTPVQHHQNTHLHRTSTKKTIPTKTLRNTFITICIFTKLHECANCEKAKWSCEWMKFSIGCLFNSYLLKLNTLSKCPNTSALRLNLSCPMISICTRKWPSCGTCCWLTTGCKPFRSSPTAFASFTYRFEPQLKRQTLKVTFNICIVSTITLNAS